MNKQRRRGETMQGVLIVFMQVSLLFMIYRMLEVNKENETLKKEVRRYEVKYGKMKPLTQNSHS